MMNENSESPELVLNLVEDQPVKKRLRVGDLCPVCQQGKLDYDGMLNLTCPHCGYAQGGSCFS